MPYKVSFYDANLDFNASIRVKANSPISIAQLKNDLDLDATALYLAGGTTNDYINNISYQVTRNVNFYAIPNVQEIKTQTELNNAVRSNLSGRYILLNDINLTSVTLGKDSEEGWNPIGYNYKRFTGVFNGNGYKITNLWINRPSANHVGLFGYISDDAQIKNLGVEIDNNKGGVKGYEYVGAIAGETFNNSSITNSYSMGIVSAKGDYVGGIAGGIKRSSITNSYSTGNVSGTGDSVGAIAGNIFDSSITNSYSTGNVSGDDSVGGIAGYVYNGFITNSYSTGDVNGTNKVGGIAGGIKRSSITNSYSMGIVSGSINVGGIAGIVGDSSITNSYSTGDVNGTNKVGGIAGNVYKATIKNSAAINQEINGSSDVNRIVGYIHSSGNTIQNNFALSAMKTNRGGFSNASVPANHGTSKSIAAFKARSTYSRDLGWKFGSDSGNPWKIDAGKNDGYPYLYWYKP